MYQLYFDFISLYHFFIYKGGLKFILSL